MVNNSFWRQQLLEKKIGHLSIPRYQVTVLYSEAWSCFQSGSPQLVDLTSGSHLFVYNFLGFLKKSSLLNCCCVVKGRRIVQDLQTELTPTCKREDRQLVPLNLKFQNRCGGVKKIENRGREPEQMKWSKRGKGGKR